MCEGFGAPSHSDADSRGALLGNIRYSRNGIMIEQRRNAGRTQIHSHPASKHERFGVIHLDPASAHKFHKERTERSTLLKPAYDSLKMLGSHINIIRRFCGEETPPRLIAR